VTLFGTYLPVLAAAQRVVSPRQRSIQLVLLYKKNGKITSLPRGVIFPKEK